MQTCSTGSMAAHTLPPRLNGSPAWRDEECAASSLDQGAATGKGSRRGRNEGRKRISAAIPIGIERLVVCAALGGRV